MPPSRILYVHTLLLLIIITIIIILIIIIIVTIFSGSVRPRIVFKKGNPISLSFPLGPDLILYLFQQNVRIIFCIDGPAFQKEIKHVSTVNIAWGG